MKYKILLLILTFILIINTVHALGESLYLQLNTTGDSTIFGNNTGNFFYQAETFDYNESPNKYISNVSMHIASVTGGGVPTCFVMVVNTTGGAPTGVVIANSSAVACNSAGFINFVLNPVNNQVLIPNTKYAIVLNSTDALANTQHSRITYNNIGGTLASSVQYQKTIGGAWVVGDVGYDLNLTLYINNLSIVSNDTINFSDIQPSNNTQFNFNNITFNVSAQTSNVFNCSFYLNGTFNESTGSIAPENPAIVQFNKTIGDGTWNYSIICSDIENIENTSTNTFFIDTVKPFYNSTGFINNSAYSSIRGSNITGQFNFSDEQILSSINVTVLNSTGNIYATLFNISGLTTKFYSYNMSFDPSSYIAENYTLRLTWADGHTDEYIEPYVIEQSLFGNSINYKKNVDETVRINPLDFGDLTTTKLIDRYTFQFEPLIKQKTLSFEVTSTTPLRYVEADWTTYKKWIVTDSQWIDFYSPENPDMEVSYTKQDENTYLVTLTNIDNTKDFIRFSSIGDLNIVSIDYYFSITNGTVTYSNPISDNSLQTMTLRINKTNLITDTNANLTWNGSLKTVTKTSGATFDSFSSTFLTPDVSGNSVVPFIWNYSILSSITELGNISLSQTILDVQVTNCTSGNITLNFTFFEEPEPLTRVTPNNFNIWINYSINDNPARLNFSYSFSGDSSYLICINPANASINATILTDFDATGYTKRNYWFPFLQLNGSSNQLMSMYQINSSTTDLNKVSLYVTDENDNVLEGWYVQVLRFDTGLNQYFPIEQIKTDINGQAVANLVLYNTRYMFVVRDQDNRVWLTAEQEEVYLTSIFLRINRQTNPMALINDLQGIAGEITYNDTTNNFTLIYTDATNTISQGCLKVFKRTIYEDELIEENCMSGTTGTIQTRTGGTNGTYFAVATVTGQTTYKSWNIATATESIGDPFTNWGLTGLFLSAFICFTLFASGIWNPAVATFLLILGMWFSWWLGLLGLGVASVMMLSFVFGIIVFRVRT